MGELGTDLVKLQRGEQADDCLRHTPANLGKRLMLGHLAVGQAVEAAGDALELAGPVELEEELRRPALRTQVSRTQQSLATGEFEDACGLGG
jgi:hypothetical protein